MKKLFFYLALMTCVCVFTSCHDDCDCGGNCSCGDNCNCHNCNCRKITPDSVSVGYNGATITFNIENKNLLVGETLKVKVTKTPASSNAGAAIILDNDDMTTITEFPYTYERVMQKEGTYTIVFRIGNTVHAETNGVVSVSVDASNSTDLPINISVSK